MATNLVQSSTNMSDSNSVASAFANGLEIVTIALALGISEQRVADWEAGIYRIPARYLLSISKLFSCPLSIFFEEFLNEAPFDEEADPSENKVDWLFNRYSAKH